MLKIKSLKQKMIKRFGKVYESAPGNYWQQYEYLGPFSKEPQGKFFLKAPMGLIKKHVESLLPYIRNNEIIGLKHNLHEN
ncbi:hypothetical protein JW756_02560 [Candidatus Woesearchaeota archaeon]|nr:hypothetical protein [Candidatus Woesearchaeota archaeon]